MTQSLTVPHTKLDDLNLVDKFLFDETMEDTESYQAQLDVSLLEPGSVDFNQLNDSCFILIAPFDIFGRGLYRYTFEGTCLECPDLKIQDGARRIFINTNGTNDADFSQEFLDFMKYITSSTDEAARNTSSSKIKLIHQNVRKIKASEKMGVKFMQQWEIEVLARQEGREEGLKEGIKEGFEKGTKSGLESGIKALITDNLEENIPMERIIEKLIHHFSLTKENAEEYYKEYTKHHII